MTMGFWDPMIHRISRKLDGWKKALLIQSCLSHIPTYCLSLFKTPSSVVLKVEKLQRDFLGYGSGGKRDHLVSWDVVCRPKEFGGIVKSWSQNPSVKGKSSVWSLKIVEPSLDSRFRRSGTTIN